MTDYLGPIFVYEIVGRQKATIGTTLLLFHWETFKILEWIFEHKSRRKRSMRKIPTLLSLLIIIIKLPVHVELHVVLNRFVTFLLWIFVSWPYSSTKENLKRWWHDKSSSTTRYLLPWVTSVLVSAPLICRTNYLEVRNDWSIRGPKVAMVINCSKHLGVFVPTKVAMGIKF